MSVVAVEQLDFDCSAPLSSSSHLIRPRHVFCDLSRRLEVDGGHVTDDVTYEVARGRPQEAGVARLTCTESVDQRGQPACTQLGG